MRMGGILSAAVTTRGGGIGAGLRRRGRRIGLNARTMSCASSLTTRRGRSQRLLIGPRARTHEIRQVATGTGCASPVASGRIDLREGFAIGALRRKRNPAVASRSAQILWGQSHHRQASSLRHRQHQHLLPLSPTPHRFRHLSPRPRLPLHLRPARRPARRPSKLFESVSSHWRRRAQPWRPVQDARRSATGLIRISQLRRPRCPITSPSKWRLKGLWAPQYKRGSSQQGRQQAGSIGSPDFGIGRAP